MEEEIVNNLKTYRSGSRHRQVTLSVAEDHIGSGGPISYVGLDPIDRLLVYLN